MSGYMQACRRVVIVLACVTPSLAADPYDVLYDTIMVRRGPDGKDHGAREVAPIFFGDSKFLIEGESHDEFMKALDAFAVLSREKVASYSIVQRALLQRHLWDIFDTTTYCRHFDWQPELRKLRPRIAGIHNTFMRRKVTASPILVAICLAAQPGAAVERAGKHSERLVTLASRGTP